jgi:tetratricopeptide (TPR) repeat protein
MVNSILSVKLLGPFEISFHGRQLRLERTKHKALIAYLCLNKTRAFPRSQLADFLWEQTSEERAKHSLNQALYSIRRIVPDLIDVQRNVIRCNASVVSTDIETVLTLLGVGDVQKALVEIRGVFLEDVDIRNASSFESWKSDFNRHFTLRTNKLIEAGVSALPPADRRRLKIPPHLASSLQELQLSVDGPDVVPPQIEYKPNIPVTSNVRVPFVLPFVGRHEALEKLSNSFAACEKGKPSFNVILGQAGHGKTRLVDEFLSSLPSGYVYRVKCHDAERRVGFGPVVDLLSNCFSDEQLCELKPIWRTVLGELAPDKFRDAPPPPRLSGLASQSRLFEAFHQLLRETAKRDPLVIFIDDVQWADESTRALLSYITHTIRDTRLMLLVALRIKSPGSVVQSPWDLWSMVEVAELTPSQAAEIVAQVLPQPETHGSSAAHIIHLTGGHPYLLSEVLGRAVHGDAGDLRSLDKELVQRVAHFVSSLFQSLPRNCQKVLAALAILGRPAPSYVVRRIANVPNLSEALDALIARGLAAIGPGGIALRHDLIREAAYRRIPPFTRTYLHRRAASALRRNEKHIGEAAEHFFKGGLRTRAFENALAAADLSDARYAYHETISFLKLALRAHPSRKAEILPILAERLYRVHRIRDAHSALDRAFRATPNWPNEFRIVDLELRYSLGKIAGSSLREEINDLRSSPAFSDPSVMFRVLKLQARNAHHEGDYIAATQATKELRTFAMHVGGAESLEAIAFAARAHSLLVSSFEAENWLLEALNDEQSIPHSEAGIRIMGMFGTILYDVGKLQAAEEMQFKAMRISEEIGAIREWPLLAANAHMLLVEQGRYDQARQLAARIRERVQGEGSHALAALVANEAFMCYELQDYEAAEKHCTETFKHTRTIQSIWIELDILGLQGLVFLAQGRRSEARRCEQSARAGVRRLGYRAGDVSHIEILSARVASIYGDLGHPTELLREAIADYGQRDMVCRLRMQLELAKLCKSSDRSFARAEANRVFTEASSMGARPLAEAADALLLRL